MLALMLIFYSPFRVGWVADKRFTDEAPRFTHEA
jgi:hypothetical protein